MKSNITTHNNCIVLDGGAGPRPVYSQIKLLDSRVVTAIWNYESDLKKNSIVTAKEYKGNPIFRICNEHLDIEKEYETKLSDLNIGDVVQAVIKVLLDN